MIRPRRSIPRGLTLLELTLALAVTALIAGAISGMLHAVTMGVGARRDTRSTMVGTNAAATRIAAYVSPSRCILASAPDHVVLWFHDERQGETVHASEVRWLLFDESAGTLEVVFLDFPDAWSQVARDLADKSYPASTDWMQVLGTYESNGWTSSIVLVDGLEDLAITTDAENVRAARHVAFTLSFSGESGTVQTHTAATIRRHETPIK